MTLVHDFGTVIFHLKMRELELGDGGQRRCNRIVDLFPAALPPQIVPDPP